MSIGHHVLMDQKGNISREVDVGMSRYDSFAITIIFTSEMPFLNCGAIFTPNSLVKSSNHAQFQFKSEENLTA